MSAALRRQQDFGDEENIFFEIFFDQKLDTAETQKVRQGSRKSICRGLKADATLASRAQEKWCRGLDGSHIFIENERGAEAAARFR